MTPNARRLIANTLTHELRRGWRRYTASRSLTAAPRSRDYIASGGYTTGASTEIITSYRYVSAYIPADQQLATPDLAIHLTRLDHDTITQRLHPLDEVLTRRFVTAGRALPFRRAGPRLRWNAEHCPEPAMRALLQLTTVTTVEVLDPRDVADAYADHELRVDLDTLQAAARAAEEPNGEEGDLTNGRLRTC